MDHRDIKELHSSLLGMPFENQKALIASLPVSEQKMLGEYVRSMQREIHACLEEEPEDEPFAAHVEPGVVSSPSRSPLRSAQVYDPSVAHVDNASSGASSPYGGSSELNPMCSLVGNDAPAINIANLSAFIAQTEHECNAIKKERDLTAVEMSSIRTEIASSIEAIKKDRANMAQSIAAIRREQEMSKSRDFQGTDCSGSAESSGSENYESELCGKAPDTVNTPAWTLRAIYQYLKELPLEVRRTAISGLTETRQKEMLNYSGFELEISSVRSILATDDDGCNDPARWKFSWRLRALYRHLSELSLEERHQAIDELHPQRRQDLLAYLLSAGEQDCPDLSDEDDIILSDEVREFFELTKHAVLSDKNSDSVENGLSDAKKSRSELQVECENTNSDDSEPSTSSISRKGVSHYMAPSSLPSTPSKQLGSRSSSRPVSPVTPSKQQLAYRPRNMMPLGALQTEGRASRRSSICGVDPSEQDDAHKRAHIEASGFNGKTIRSWLSGKLSGEGCLLRITDGVQWARFSSNPGNAKQLGSTVDLYSESSADGHGGALGGMVGGVARALAFDNSIVYDGVFSRFDGSVKGLSKACAWVNRHTNGPGFGAKHEDQGAPCLKGVVDQDINLAFSNGLLVAHPHRKQGQLEEYLKVHLYLEILRQWVELNLWPDLFDAAPENETCGGLSDTELMDVLLRPNSELVEDAKTKDLTDFKDTVESLSSHVLRLSWLKEKLAAEVSHMKSHGAYEMIGVDPGVSDVELARAYKAQALLLHPDRSTGSTEAFQALQACYQQILEQRAIGRSKSKSNSSTGTQGSPKSAEQRQERSKDARKSPKAESQSSQSHTESKNGVSKNSPKQSSQESPKQCANQSSKESSQESPKQSAKQSSQESSKQSLNATEKNSEDKLKKPQRCKLSKKYRAAECNKQEGNSRKDTILAEIAANKGVFDDEPSDDDIAAPSNDNMRSNRNFENNVSEQDKGKVKSNVSEHDKGKMKSKDHESPLAQLKKEGPVADDDIDQEELEKVLDRAVRGIPAESIASWAEIALQGAQTMSKLVQQSGEEAVKSGTSWLKLKTLALQALQAAHNTAEQAGAVGKTAVEVPTVVMPLLDALSKRSPHLRAEMARQVIEGTKTLLHTAERVSQLGKEAFSKNEALIIHSTEVGGALHKVSGLDQASQSTCDHIVSCLKALAVVAREAANSAASAALMTGETQRRAENLFEILRAAGLLESNEGEEHQENDMDEDSDDDDDEKEPWERHVNFCRVFRKLNQDVVELQKELRILVTQNPSLIHSVTLSQKVFIFSVVAEVLEQAKEAVINDLKQERDVTKAGKKMDFVFAASDWDKIALPSLEARMLRLASLVDGKQLRSMLEECTIHILAHVVDGHATFAKRLSQACTALLHGLL